MTGRVEILCHHHRAEGTRQSVDGADDGITTNKPKHPPFTEVILNIDNDESVTGLDIELHAGSPRGLNAGSMGGIPPPNNSPARQQPSMKANPNWFMCGPIMLGDSDTTDLVVF